MTILEVALGAFGALEGLEDLVGEFWAAVFTVF
jgi:hypothetical protein